MGLLINWGNVAVFLIPSMVLGLLDQLQIFSLWYLIELLESVRASEQNSVDVGSNPTYANFL